MKVLLLGVQLASLVQFRGPLIQDLVAAGHEVVAVAPEPQEARCAELRALGARYVEAPLQRTGLNPLADLRLAFWLWRMFRREKPDVLLAFQAKAVIYGLRAAAAAGIRRRVAMIEGLGLGFISGGDGWKRRLARLMIPVLYRASLGAAHAVIFLNPDDEAEFRTRGLVGKAGQEVVRIPGIGVDVGHYAQEPLPPGPPFTCVMIARLLVDKGVREFAEAARLVRRDLPGTRFVLFGPADSGPAGIPLAEVEGWNREGVLIYEGETADVRPGLAASHVFVLPTSYREGFPRASLEAMATGRAIVTTDAPGAREAVRPGVNGLLVPPRNATALAETLVSLLRQPHLLTAFAKASRQKAVESHDVRGVNRQILSCLLRPRASDPLTPGIPGNICRDRAAAP